MTMVAPGFSSPWGASLFDRFLVARWVKKVANDAGVGHVHPHQLRHTLATQAVNRGMHLEAVAELLGHRDLKMTQVYARISNKTLADKFTAVADKVDALYAEANKRRHRCAGCAWSTGACRQRLVHQGRGAHCHFEAICEGCGFFETTVEFLPVLRNQRDHAAAHGQPVREELYDRLVTAVERRRHDHGYGRLPPGLPSPALGGRVLSRSARRGRGEPDHIAVADVRRRRWASSTPWRAFVARSRPGSPTPLSRLVTNWSHGR